MGIVIQFVIVYFLLMDVIEPMESGYEQNHYDLVAATQTLKAAVQDGTPLVSSDDSSEGILRRCKAQKVHRFMYVVIVFVWLSKMSHETLESMHHATRVIRADQRYYPHKHMIHRGNITCLDLWIKVAIILLVSCVECVIAVLVGFAGAKMLLLTISEGELILKSLCLQFVVNIDELVYNSFTTA